MHLQHLMPTQYVNQLSKLFYVPPLFRHFFVHRKQLKLCGVEGEPSNVFCPRSTLVGVAIRSYKFNYLYQRDDRSAQNCNTGRLVTLYGSTMHLTIPRRNSSFAALHTEKLAFQCATLLSWEQSLAIRLLVNLAVLCGDFSVSVPSKKKKKKKKFGVLKSLEW